jgi:pimeloyl-ACP methyl ester carboxylesterase
MSWQDFQARQRVVEIGERYLSYIDEGSGAPLVLLHGIPTWGYLWSTLIPPLAEQFRVLAPDLAGFGFSDKRDRFDRSIARQTDYLDAWLHTIGVDRATVVGHDIGGGVALRLATLKANRVERLVVMNTVCYDSWPVEWMLQLGYPAANRRLSGRMLNAILRHALKSGFHSSPPSALLEGLLAPYRTDVGKLSLIRSAAALDTNHTTEIVSQLPEVRIPTMILWGAEDPFQPVEYGRRLADDIPNARFEMIPKASHFAMIDRPRVIIGLLREFMSSGSVTSAMQPFSVHGVPASV